MQNTEPLGLEIPEVLVPDEKVNMKKWSVIACDQYTSSPQYWQEVERFVGSSPSTLHMMLPEAYLGSQDTTQRIAATRQVMDDYISSGILEQLPEGLILVEREICGKPRCGLMVLVDLEQYSFEKDSRPLIRASEQTLLERIPPRVTIRRGAPVELPHVLLLMDDPERTVIEPIYALRDRLAKIYDFDLMMNGGHINGYFIEKGALTESIMNTMRSLPVRDGMRFCVGDGNHSLATAKTIWDEAKLALTPAQAERSPLRYALAELINIHDTALTFEPIHRVLFRVNPTNCVQFVVDELNANGAEARLIFSQKRAKLRESDVPTVYFKSHDSAGRIEITKPYHPVAAGMLQPILDKYLSENPSAAIDYIHGTASFDNAASDYDCLGFMMPALSKDSFFDTVIECGVLPRKCFSLGEADEKRFYLECRFLGKKKTPDNSQELSLPQDE